MRPGRACKGFEKPFGERWAEDNHHGQSDEKNGNADDDEEVESEEVVLPFQKVDLTFKDIHYTVTASVGNEKLELLKGIDGVVEAGKMTALVSLAWKRSFDSLAEGCC